MFLLPLRKVYAFMLMEGFSVNELLAGTDLTEADFEDPYHIVSSTQARTFYLNTVSLGQTGMGLEIGYATKLLDMGLRGFSISTSKSVGDALKDAVNANPLYHVLGHWRVEVFEKVWINYMSTSEEFERPLSVFLLERGIALLQANMEEMCGAITKPTRLLLSYPKPANFKRYEEIFCCPVLYDQPGVEVHYPVEYLVHKFETYDQQAHEATEATIDTLLATIYSKGNLVEEIKQYLRRNKGQLPQLNQVAVHFSISPRTMRRKLASLDTSFQEILDAERLRLAEHFLSHTSANINEIAARMGYTNPQNFSKAFKLWSGVSPSEYRQSNSN
jgi:AraC-like DNA-binding protein